ncbi:unnamed protein product, partial [marine sediment metagenome]
WLSVYEEKTTFEGSVIWVCIQERFYFTTRHYNEVDFGIP